MELLQVIRVFTRRHNGIDKQGTDIERFGIKTQMYKDWGISQTEYWRRTKDELVDNKELSHERTQEFASYIMESLITGNTYKIAAKVLNQGYISNLPDNSCVEVPCLVDGTGICILSYLAA